MKIKIIDLLNIYAKNEKMPREIKHQYYDYSWNDFAEDYQKGDGEMLFGNMKLVYHLNDEVEILEEDKPTIEKITINENHTIGFPSGEWKARNMDIAFSVKINQIIDYINRKEDGKN